MRIAYVTSHFPPSIGGVETHVDRLATAAARAGHEVEVIVPGRNGEARPDLKVRRFPVAVGGRNFALAPGIWRFLSREGASYDLVHAHNYHALPALAAALVATRHLVFTPHYHGTGHSRFRTVLHHPYRAIGTKIVNRAARVVCVSRPEARLFDAHFPGACFKTTVIPNGVDSARLTSAQPFAIDGRVVLVAGRLERYKRVDRAIQALAGLPEDFRLVVLGEGPARPSLEHQAATSGLQDRVNFVGRVSEHDRTRWLRTATAVVTMSEHEAFGLVAAEALCAGAAVFASDIDAHRELARLAPEANMTIVAAHAPASVLSRAISLGGRSSVEPRGLPSWEEVAARTLGLYSEVLSEGLRS